MANLVRTRNFECMNRLPGANWTLHQELKFASKDAHGPHLRSLQVQKVVQMSPSIDTCQQVRHMIL